MLILRNVNFKKREFHSCKSPPAFFDQPYTCWYAAQNEASTQQLAKLLTTPRGNRGLTITLQTLDRELTFEHLSPAPTIPNQALFYRGSHSFIMMLSI
jgi:hypothetical protein